MNKKIYLASLKLFSWHLLFLGGLVGVYRLLVNVILNTEKLFDILFITTIFNILALIISFYFAIKIVKKEEKELFKYHHRLLLFLYILNFVILALIVFIFLIVFKDLSLSLFLFGALILLLYVYYYFLRLTYYILFFGKLRLTIIVLVVILTLGYSLLLFLPQSNYRKIYNETKVGADFNYFHRLDLDDIVGKRNLQDKNSAKDLVKLINLLATDEKILDEGEKLSYILPTEVELELLSDIVKNIYLNISEEYLSKEVRKTGGMIVTPLNDLRFFSRGIVKLSEQKKEQGYDDESIEMLNNLLLLGNQMLSIKNDTLISKIVGDSMMREGLAELMVVYENDDFKIEAIASMIKELDDIRNGQRLLRTTVFHMKDEVIGSAKNTAIFFKHLVAQKDNIGSDFDMELITNNMSLADGFIIHDSTNLKKFVLSFMILPITLPFELNIGNGYIVYRETKKLSKEPGHEMLDYYFKTSYTNFTEIREANRKKAVGVVAEEG